MERRYYIVYTRKSTIKVGTSPPIYLNKQSPLYHISKDQFLPKTQLPSKTNTFKMRFSILALATILGLAFAAPLEANKDGESSVQTNNCYTLCIIDGGVSSFRFPSLIFG